MSSEKRTKQIIWEFKYGGFTKNGPATSTYGVPTQQQIDEITKFAKEYNYKLDDIKTILIVDNFAASDLVFYLKNGVVKKFLGLQIETPSSFNRTMCEKITDSPEDIATTKLTLWAASSY